jgi:uncharacterized protein (DUF433 family)
MCDQSQYPHFVRGDNVFLGPDIEESMYYNKPIRQPKQPKAEVPTYTIPEAATFLAMSSGTLYSWYASEHPILRASGYLKIARESIDAYIALLSFRDLEEAYKIHLLRFKHRKSLQYLRVLIIPGRGKRARRAITLGDSSVPDYIPEVVKTWGIRISKTRNEMFPWRYAADDDVSTPVAMNPEVMSGRLVLTGTRIPVNILWGRSRAGEDIKNIADDYRIDERQVRQALSHIDEAIPKVA